MIPRSVSAPYAVASRMSAEPWPADWRSSRTISSDRPHRPSRTRASAAPSTVPSSSSVTQAPPGSVSTRWSMRMRAVTGSRAPQAATVRARTDAESSCVIGREHLGGG